MFVISQNATSAWTLCIVTSATKNSATTAKIASTAVESAAWHHALSARTTGYLAINSKMNIVSTAKICLSVTSATRHFARTANILSTVANVNHNTARNAKTASAVTSAKRYSALAAKILSTVKSVRKNSALIAKIPSLAANANQTSVLGAESRFLVTVNASISFVPSSAKKFVHVVVQRAKRSPSKHPEYQALRRLSSQTGHMILTCRQLRQARSASHSRTPTTAMLIESI
jgi:hypothetical protein